MPSGTVDTKQVVEKPERLPDAHPRVTTRVLVAFAAVYLVWGSTYLAMKVGIESFPPLILAGLRHFVVGVVLYPFLRWKTKVKPTRTNWKAALVTGALLLLIGNGGVCYSEKTVPTGVAALLVAMVSFWMVIVDWLRPGGVRPMPRVIMGLLLGFGGMVLLVGPAHLGGSERIDPGGALILVVASFAWACGSLYSKHGGMPNSAILGVAMQGLAGGAMLLTGGFLLGEFRGLHHAAITMRSWLALAYLILFGSGIGFSAYLYILRESTATRVATYAFVNPVVALFLGWVFAGEPLTLRTGIAAAIILTAVILVITAPHRTTVPLPRSAPAASET